ncbi:MAG: HAD family hydrolase [Candidatus Eremiobacteraeota bacterium]|nr:HAD family hydrolase [Candidatus Eremiobacteraeota bacterium]
MIAVLLDIDGTLLDSNGAHAAAWSDAFAAFGYAIPKMRVLPLIGMGGDKVMATLVPGLQPDDGGLGARIGGKRAQIFKQTYLPSCKPTRGARALLEELKRRDCTLVMATSAKGDELYDLLRAAGVEDLIDNAASSDDARASKPEPGIVVAALQKAGAGPENAIMLGDTPYDILAAHSAGIRIVALRCGGWHEPELADAQAVYDDPAAVLAHLDVPPLTEMIPSGPETRSKED